MKCVIGLGNPGREYAMTRHNVGFMVLDRIADERDVPLKAGKGRYIAGSCRVGTSKVLLIKPTTYMNESGLAIRGVVDYYRLEAQDILVVYDDVALPLGRLRIRMQGSSGGQKGMESAIYHLKTDEFTRLRIGVGSEARGNMPLARFVLTSFRSEERELLQTVIETAKEAVDEWIVTDTERVMNRFNAIDLNKHEA